MARVATWNLENLFRPGVRSAASATTEAYAAKLDALAGTIRRLDLDVLAVQEVADPAALQDLIERLPGGGWTAAVADPDGRGIRVGVVSRFALMEVEQVRTVPAGLAPVQFDDSWKTITGMGRPALRVQVSLESLSVDVVSVHLKSKLLSLPGGRFAPTDEDERGAVRRVLTAAARR